MAKATVPAKPITHSALVQKIAESTDLTKKQVTAVFEELADTITSELKKSGTINLFRLIKIKRIDVPAKPARRGINPFTKEEQDFPAKPATRKVKINPLKALKDVVV